MALTQAALKTFTKEEIIKFTLDLRNNFNHDLKYIKKDLSELSKNFSKPEVEFAVTKQINNVWRNQMVQVKRKSWSNKQYARRECLEIVVSILESVTDSSLEETALSVFKELGVSIDTSHIETYHYVRPPSRKKVIVKMSRRKDADRMPRVKKNLKGMKLESLEVDNPITSLYGPSVRGFGPIRLYKLVGCQIVP